MDKVLRACENIEKKTSSFRNHQVFTLHWRDKGLIPSSLRLKCPIKTQKTHDIVYKAEKELLSERIRVINNKIERLHQQKSRLNADLNSEASLTTSKQPFLNISRNLARNLSKMSAPVSKVNTIVLWKKQRKSKENITKSSNSTGTVDLSESQLKKWVVNLSKYKVTNAQNKALNRALNFALSPDNVQQRS